MAVPIQAFTVQKGEKELLVNLDKKQLDQAPGFAKNEWPDLNAVEQPREGRGSLVHER